jgi:lipopolysaccharide/colanic/teichoic acid biosynthesis glycosyltransferase
MILRKWEDLPPEMQCDEVRPYYDILRKKQALLIIKRLFDIVVSALMLVALSPLFLILALAVKLDSKGSVFFRQVRVTQYGKRFRIFKFRTMVQDADKLGTQVTIQNDARITRIGRFLRKYRLDELSQLIDIFRGTMTFVGTRPEVPKYVDAYTPEMMATLLLPAGVTSEASIRYKDEERFLNNADDVDRVYIEEVLPAKMKFNLEVIRNFQLYGELLTVLRTVLSMLKKDTGETEREISAKR